MRDGTAQGPDYGSDWVTKAPTSKHLVVVGGGFSGMSTVLQTLGETIEHPEKGKVAITVIERDDEMRYGGVAYGQAGVEHHMNVPAKWVSAIQNNPDDLTDWLMNARKSGYTGDEAHLNVPKELLKERYDGESAIPRRLYQHYLRHRVHQMAKVAKREGLLEGDIQHVTGEAVAVSRDAGHVDVTVAAPDGSTQIVSGTHLALTTGHKPSTNPPFARNVATDDPLRDVAVFDQWNEAEKMERAFRDPNVKNVVVVGTGLSAMDVVATAARTGWLARDDTELTLVSSSGHVHERLENSSYPVPVISKQDLPETPRRIEDVPAYAIQVIGQYEQQGFERHAVIEAMMDQHLPRLLKECQIPVKAIAAMHKQYSSLVNTSLVQMAAEVADVYDKYVDEGHVKIEKGHIQQLERDADGKVRITAATPGSDETRELKADFVVASIGPNNDYTRDLPPLYRSLFDQGLAQADTDTRIGIKTDITGRLVCPSSEEGGPEAVTPNIYAVGPHTGGMLMVRHGKIGPYNQVISGLRAGAAHIAKSVVIGPEYEPALTTVVKADVAGIAVVKPEDEPRPAVSGPAIPSPSIASPAGR